MIHNYNYSSVCHDTEINSYYVSGTTGKETHPDKHDTRPACSFSPFYFNADFQAATSNFISV